MIANVRTFRDMALLYIGLAIIVTELIKEEIKCQWHN